MKEKKTSIPKSPELVYYDGLSTFTKKDMDVIVERMKSKIKKK